MVSEDRLSTLLLIVGIGLLLNPVYFAPDTLIGGSTEITYGVEPIEEDHVARHVVRTSGQTLQCDSERSCVLETEIAEQGSVEYNGTVQPDTDQFARWDPLRDARNRYHLVAIDGEFYIPAQESTDNSTVLTHEPVSTDEALGYLAVPTEYASTGVQTAIEQGSVTVIDTTIPEFESDYPISDGGTFYHVTRHSSDGGIAADVFFGRFFLWSLGSALVFHAWKRRGNT